MKFALTGVNINPGRLTDNIRQQADKSAVSGVIFTFEHCGRIATVKRWLRPSSRPSELTLSDEPDTIRGDKKIDARIEQLLGSDSHIINDITIVNQNDVFGFLAQTPAKRSAAYAKIFHTEDAEEAWSVCGKHQSEHVVHSVVDNVAEMEQELANFNRYIADMRLVIGNDNATDINAQWLAATNRMRELADARDKMEEIPRLKQQIKDNEARVAELDKSIRDLDLNINTLKEAATRSKGFAEDAKVSLANWDRDRQEAEERYALIDAYEEIPKEPELRAQLPESYAFSVGLQAYITELQREVSEINAFLSALDSGSCPTCGTEAAVLESAIEAKRLRHAEALELINELSVKRTKASTYERRMSQWRFEEHQRRSKLAAYDGVDLTELPMPTTQHKQGWEFAIKEYESFVEAVETFTKDCNILTHQRDVARISINNDNALIDSINEKLAAYNVQPGETEQIQDNVTRLQNRFHEVSAAEKDLAGLTASANAIAERIAQTKQALTVSEKERVWAARVNAMRDVLHRDAAPRFVFQRNLQRLQSGANQFLAMFDTDYRVTAAEGTSFVANFADHTNQPAERLSGGEKVVLALSVRLALNFMYADLNFMALDEPTAYLDAHHIQGFRPVLARLREFAASRGLQCIIITHETALSPLFDSVVTL
jgi:exonuclease SbcC